MSRPAASFVALLATFDAAAAMRLASKDSHVVSAECSPSMLYEKVGSECYDLSGELADGECCEQYDACRQDVKALGEQCAKHIQVYFQDCELLQSDVSTDDSEDGQLRITDTTRMCSENCQAQTALMSESPLVNLDELETRCSPHLERIRMMVKAVQHFDATWAACSSPLEAEDKSQVAKPHRKPRWGPVEITIHWVPPVVNLKAAFETLWTALPCTYSDEFHIKGTVGAIQEELLLRPELPISCPEEHVGKPVNLVVSKISPTGWEAYEKAFTSGFANVAGLATFAAASATLMHVGGEGARLLSVLGSNPSKFNLDNAVDFIMTHAHRSDSRTLKKFWRWMKGTKTAAFLTLADPEKKNYDGATVRFQCNMVPFGSDGDTKAVATWVDDAGDVQAVVTAKHLAFLITRLA